MSKTIKLDIPVDSATRVRNEHADYDEALRLIRKYMQPGDRLGQMFMRVAKALETTDEKPAHKIMTPEEYAAMPLKGWHEVCRDVDGFGGVGVRFLGL